MCAGVFTRARPRRAEGLASVGDSADGAPRVGAPREARASGRAAGLRERRPRVPMAPHGEGDVHLLPRHAIRDVTDGTAGHICSLFAPRLGARGSRASSRVFMGGIPRTPQHARRSNPAPNMPSKGRTGVSSTHDVSTAYSKENGARRKPARAPRKKFCRTTRQFFCASGSRRVSI